MLETIVIIFVLLVLKHFVCDFPLQAFPYMYRNKGTYGHPGGILHAAVHGVGTLAIMLVFVDPILALILAAVDMIAHYHIDWAKMNITRAYGLRPDNSEMFWILLGVDQLLHYMTYIGMIWFLISYY